MLFEKACPEELRDRIFLTVISTKGEISPVISTKGEISPVISTKG
jgi:hypothetical protein